jgi:MFS family permease
MADDITVGAGFVPAAFGPIAISFDVTKQQASYLTTTYTLFGGITPLLITPFANLYGRRPIYIVSLTVRQGPMLSTYYWYRYSPLLQWQLILAPDTRQPMQELSCLGYL